MKNTFITIRTDGLGERLRAMTNAIVLSEHFSGNFKFHWKPIGKKVDKYHSIGTVESIFSKKFINSYHEDDITMVKRQIIEMREFDVKQPISNKMIYKVNQVLPKALRKIFSHIEYRDAFYKIEFSKDLEIAKKLANNLILDENTVAIHMRAGDIVYGLYRFMPQFVGKALPYPLVIDLIQKLKSDNKKVLLFGQDSELCHFLVNEYGVKFANDLSSSGFTNEQHALFDIILMSRCEEVIAGTSGFARLACLIGNIDRIDPNDIYEEKKAIKIIIESLKDNIINKAINPLQVSFACNWALEKGKDIIEKEDYLYLVDLGFENDSDNYMFPLLKSMFYYKVEEPIKAEELIVTLVWNDENSRRFYHQLNMSFGFITNPKIAIEEHFNIIKKYADNDFPIASLLLTGSPKRTSESDDISLYYAKKYLKNKKVDLEFFDEKITKTLKGREKDGT